MKQALLNSAEHYPFLEPFRLQQRQFTEADYFPRLQQQLTDLPIDPEGSSLLVHRFSVKKGAGSSFKISSSWRMNKLFNSISRQKIPLKFWRATPC